MTPPYAGTSRKRAGGLGFFGLFPATPTGAVAARSLSYWLRDPRYAGALVVVPLLPVLLLFQAAQTGSYGMLLFVGPLTAFLLAWSISTDVSYDNTAFALHLSTGVRGVHDRLGRAVACLVFALPAVLALSLLPFLFGADGSSCPVCSDSPSACCSAGWDCPRWYRRATPSPCRCPGTAPSRNRPGNVAQTMAVQFGGMGVLFLLVLPETALLVAQFITGSAVPGWINLALGPVLGLALFAAGVRLGGKWLDARGPELLAQLTVNR